MCAEGAVEHESPSAPLMSERRAGTRRWQIESRAAGVRWGAVLMIVAANNATGGKDPYVGHRRNESACQTMTGTTDPNSPAARLHVANSQQPRPELSTAAKRSRDARFRRRRDVRRPVGPRE